jgi:hypothetical protein
MLSVMQQSELPRIIVDANNRLPSGEFIIWGEDSGLEQIPEERREGLRVIIYEPDEYEMEATLRFYPEWKWWVASGDELNA